MTKGKKKVLGDFVEVKIKLLLSRKEYQELHDHACMTAEGTIAAAVREQMEWNGTPYGYKAAKKRAKKLSS